MFDSRSPDLTLRVHVPMYHIVFTLALKYLNSGQITAKVFSLWVHGPLNPKPSTPIGSLEGSLKGTPIWVHGPLGLACKSERLLMIFSGSLHSQLELRFKGSALRSFKGSLRAPLRDPLRPLKEFL